MTSIYFAAPLHDEADQERSRVATQKLRDAGFYVYNPLEHGVWEGMVQKKVSEGMRESDAIAEVRRHLYKMDVVAMKRCEVCVMYHGREKGPSEGQLWEAGFMKGRSKTLILVNEVGHRFNLMPEFGADMCFSSLEDAIQWMKDEDF